MAEIQNYLNAAKFDILEHLEKEKPGVFEFRRIAAIANAIQPLITSAGTPSEHRTLASVMSEAEDIAPHLHEALSKRAFDGSALLREKYAKLLAHHQHLKRAMLDVQDAASQVSLDRQELDMHEAALKAHEQVLERERERLQLEAKTRGRKIELPALPRLVDPNTDEDADAETEEG